MKLIDALTQFETRIAKSEGGLVSMSPDDVVKYIGEQLALVETEGDASKERLAAVKSVIEAVKAAEATGATAFEVKPFVTAVKAVEPEAAKDPLLTALEALNTKVEALKSSIAAPAVVPDGATVVAVKGAEGEGSEPPAADVSKAQGDAGNAEPPKPVAVRWPTDLNRKG